MIHFSSSGYDDPKTTPLGFRIPGVFTRQDGRLYVFTQIDDKIVDSDHTIAVDTWYKVEIQQTKNHKGEVKNNDSLSCVKGRCKKK